jgi:hypothetical protein
MSVRPTRSSDVGSLPALAQAHEGADRTSASSAPHRLDAPEVKNELGLRASGSVLITDSTIPVADSVSLLVLGIGRGVDVLETEGSDRTDLSDVLT